MEPELRAGGGDKTDKAKQVGALIAKRAKEAGVEQGTQVMGDGRLGESHLIGQDAGGRPSVVRGSDQAQQPQPRGVGQHLQRPGQGQRIAGLQGGLQDR